MNITVDGTLYDIDATVSRTAEVSASEISGLMLDRSYFNDVLGTYMQYDITLEYPLYNRQKYANLFEALSNPNEAHSFTFPYNNDVITLTARVETVSDTVVVLHNGFQFWQKTRFSIISNYPSKFQDLDDVIEAGRMPMPTIAQPAEGDTYTYSNNEWVLAQSYDDADEKSY